MTQKRLRKLSAKPLRANSTLLSAAVAAIVFVQGADAFQKAGSATPPAGNATGTLTVGSSTFRLSYAYVFPEKQGYRIFVTNRALTASAVKLASSAGANEDDRQQLVVELSESKVHGLETIIGADKQVIRANIYSPDSVLGMMLLAPTQFQATTFDAQRIAGKLFTQSPIQDARIRKTVQYEATFSAPIHRPAVK